MIVDGKYSMFHQTNLAICFPAENTDNSKDKDEALEAPRRPFTRSQAKEMQDKVAGLQWETKKVLFM